MYVHVGMNVCVWIDIDMSKDMDVDIENVVCVLLQ